MTVSWLCPHKRPLSKGKEAINSNQNRSPWFNHFSVDCSCKWIVTAKETTIHGIFTQKKTAIKDWIACRRETEAEEEFAVSEFCSDLGKL